MDNFEVLHRELERLSAQFNDDKLGVVDCAYILKKGLNIKWMIEKYVGFEMNEIHYDPHTLDRERRIVHGEMNPSRYLLLIDDSFHRGASFREAVSYFQSQGYQCEKIHGLNILSRKFCAVSKIGIPNVLLPS